MLAALLTHTHIHTHNKNNEKKKRKTPTYIARSIHHFRNVIRLSFAQDDPLKPKFTPRPHLSGLRQAIFEGSGDLDQISGPTSLLNISQLKGPLQTSCVYITVNVLISRV